MRLSTPEALRIFRAWENTSESWNRRDFFAPGGTTNRGEPEADTKLFKMTADPHPPALPAAYDPQTSEPDIYDSWLRQGVFTADAGSDKLMFSIVIPPPNVTGSLHLGHTFEHTMMDALARRRRMQGYEALWLPGMDHAGIATQNVVERHLAQGGLSRHDLGREKFVERTWQWKQEYGGKILDQMRRFGVGVDWSRERFTMDEGLSQAVLTIFKNLYDDGLIYRAERIINWCPRCQTALSDAEVDHSDDDGELVSIRYGQGESSIVVATTRAETMLGDTAVAVHPDDQRYRHLVGTVVELPLTDRSIPVIADAHVDPQFGTGAVKVTPAHDPNDFAIGQRHGLAMPTIMDERGVITVPGPFEGLDRFEARPAIVAALREQGRIVAEKRPYVHAVGHCSRCNTTVEPRLSLQWFVKVAPLAAAAGVAVRDGRVGIHPPEMAGRYFDWIDNLHDWCISRQLWWGHRIPVWYGPDGQVRCVGPGEQPPTEPGWRQDEDVLDTWFSSALWPFSTLGWPQKTVDLQRFYPTSVLVTGYDILFFWVVRMMLFGLYAMGRTQRQADGSVTVDADASPTAVPFQQVVLHGLVRDQYGKKMSKSGGNAVDPLAWIGTYGSDALRFTLARGANPGADAPISEEWVKGSRNFCNKLFNATRFALSHDARVPAVGALADRGRLSLPQRWILQRLDVCVAEVNAALDAYEFARAANAAYHFVWDELCDWYVELAKQELAGPDHQADDARLVLGQVFDVMLRLLHPLLPFVTEQLWMTLTGQPTVVTAQWPTCQGAADQTGAENSMTHLQNLVTQVRRFRSDQGLRDRQRVPARLVGLEQTDLAAYEHQVRALTWLAVPTGQDAAEDFTSTASVAVSIGTHPVTVELDLAGTVDVAAERARIAKDLAAARTEQQQVQAKLGNSEFLAKAPSQVVEKIRARAAAAQADIDRLQAQHHALGGPEQERSTA